MMKSAIALFLSLSPAASLSALDSSFGSIVALIGEVRIDAFGKGSFIPAIVGDQLYPATVLKTGTTGSAEALVGGQKSKIGPGATVRVADLVAMGKKQSTPWIGGFVNLYKNIKNAAGGQADVMLGTRAAEVATEADEWVVEDGAEEVLEAARAKIDSGAWREALALLGAMPSEADAAQLQSADWMAGLAHFALEDYSEAESRLAAVLARSTDPKVGFANEEMRVRALFDLGVARYMTGLEKDAVAPLSSLLSSRINPEIDPYARLFLIKSLYASGDGKAAEAQLALARQKYRGSSFEAAFAPGPAGL